MMRMLRLSDGSVRKLARLIREVKDEQGYIVIRERHIEILLSRLMIVSSGGLSSRLVLSLLICSIFDLKRFFEVTSMV